MAICQSLIEGASAYLLKGCPRQTMIDAIRRVSSGEYYITPKVGESLMQKVRGKNLGSSEFETMRLFAAGGTSAGIGLQLALPQTVVRKWIARLLKEMGP